MSTQKSRRDFLKITAAGLAAMGLSQFRGMGENTQPISGFKVPSGERWNKTVMGMKSEPLDKVRIGLIGLGMRGLDGCDRLLKVDGVQITAVCDIIPERVEAARKLVVAAGQPEPACYSSGDEAWMQLCRRDDVNLVYICTPWELHTPNAVYAMNQGKHVAVEVPAALTLDECWQLVNTSEKTRRHCMMLENCCYDFFEMATLNMARKGLLGDIMHAECAYIHDLRWLKFDKETGYQGMWRLKYSEGHTGNPYPTHGLGPVAQIMGINRSDKLDFLTSMSTSQVGMSLYARNKFGESSPEARQGYKLGDMNTTLVKTRNGKTIMIQHDTTSPRPYSRIHLISGTKGMAQKWPDQRIALEPDSHSWLKKEEYDRIMKEYEHPLSRKIGERAREQGGHGGMDFIMDYRLSYCLRNGLPTDQDVYDAATWSSIVELSEKSVLSGSQPVEVPDFTRGEWQYAEPIGILDF